MPAQGMKRKTPRSNGFDDPLVMLHRGPHLSQAALEAVLKYVKEHGPLTAVSRRSQLRARERALQGSTPYGLVLQPLRLTLENGTPWAGLCDDFVRFFS